MLRRVAKGATVPDHYYGPSTASSNPFESISEWLELLIILNENWAIVAKNAADAGLDKVTLNHLHDDVHSLLDESTCWLERLSDEVGRAKTGAHVLMDALHRKAEQDAGQSGARDLE